MREFKVKDISGEYATLCDKDGEELFIALALLPASVDVGDTLVYENNEFR